MRTLAHPRCLDELTRRLRSLRPDSERRWGRMSVQQMVCHLGDACRMALGEMPIRDASSPVHRTLIKWFALYGPLPWPPGIVTTPELDQLSDQCTGTRPNELAADLATVETLLAAIATRPAAFKWPTHPIFGSLSRRAWLRWAYLHTDHHLRQFGA